MRYIDNPQAFTSEDMQSNVYDAANDARIATRIDAANDARIATRIAARISTRMAARIATRMAANAANAAYTANATNAANAAYTAAYDAIDWYFKRTGEDKERYNNEVERLR